MKLNNLIKYNSFKILSILGYVFAVPFYYLLITKTNQAAKLDALNGCYQEAPTGCVGDYVLGWILYLYAIYLLVSIILLLIAFIEFLYKKYKVKDSKIETYSKPWIIIFWVGMILEMLPFLLIAYIYILFLYEDYIRPFFA